MKYLDVRTGLIFENEEERKHIEERHELMLLAGSFFGALVGELIKKPTPARKRRRCR